ncbi:SAM-dependent RNA methyltransferase [Polychytrium aggregatum]|uniref:SAM-dependent RNA methyltransferase n=1 Tax=Polychytrium aggregatum TaxID=110093 RepID=UPI0022FF238D|nr:SAM-dependent RNA methyltransferase [Polychytrium aggregatum]KAI9208456.1 SAM-dependent RNA methyltransferase [Polychytrium aggregatum]
MKYIIEHFEEGLEEWCELEYSHMLSYVGEGNLILSNMHQSVLDNLPTKLEGVVVTGKSVLEIEGVTIDNCILLDPAAKEPLSPSDAENCKFLLFGGILGDDPPRDRTKELRVMGFKGRHLGPVQMTTDTAVMTSQHVLEKGIPLDELKFIDHPEIVLSKRETVQMPFRYLLNSEGKMIMPPGFKKLLRKGNDIDITTML